MRYILITYDETELEADDGEPLDLYGYLMNELENDKIGPVHLHEFSRPDSVLQQVQADCMEAGLGVQAELLPPEFKLGDLVRVSAPGYPDWYGRTGVITNMDPEPEGREIEVSFTDQTTVAQNCWFQPEELEHA